MSPRYPQARSSCAYCPWFAPTSSTQLIANRSNSRISSQRKESRAGYLMMWTPSDRIIRWMPLSQTPLPRGRLLEEVIKGLTRTARAARWAGGGVTILRRAGLTLNGRAR